MATLLRRLAPAVALGGLAIVIVGVLDPAIAVGGLSGATDASGATDPSGATDGFGANRAALSGGSAQSGGAERASAYVPVNCNPAEATTGPVITTRWGPVQVAATIAGGALCESHAVIWPTANRQSRKISAYAVPALDAQASVQGVRLDGVSGATYTTEGYRESLQQLVDSL